MKTPYDGYDVLAKWNTPSFDDRTRKVLSDRLERVPSRRFFSEPEWATLEALVARLLPQPERSRPIPVAPWIDEDLALGRGEGFRAPGSLSLREIWRRGLAGIDAEAGRRGRRAFADLAPADQDALLRAVQQGAVNREGWQGIDPAHFFVHVLLKRVAGLYYTHPAAWSEIGFGGPASPRGYVRLGFDDRDPWEARQRS